MWVLKIFHSQNLWADGTAQAAGAPGGARVEIQDYGRKVLIEWEEER